MGVLEILDGCPGDILWVSCRYLIGVLDIFVVVSLRYLMGVLEIFDGCNGDI